MGPVWPDLECHSLISIRSLSFSDPLMGLAPAHLALTGCATAQAKPCLPPLGGPRWYKSYFPPFLFLRQRMRSNGQASNS
jgi:hypothetical protein